jgi:hypothetical protein
MKVIDRDSLNRLSADAAERPRRRANWNLHPALDDPIQRFFNAMEPRTYVRPHRHDGAGRWECFFAISPRAIGAGAEGALSEPLLECRARRVAFLWGPCREILVGQRFVGARFQFQKNGSGPQAGQRMP